MRTVVFAVILCSKRAYTAGYRCEKESNVQGNQGSPGISGLGCQKEIGKEEQTAKESHFTLPVFVDGSIRWPVRPCPGRLQDWLFLFVILTVGSQDWFLSFVPCTCPFFWRDGFRAPSSVCPLPCLLGWRLFASRSIAAGSVGP